MDYRFRDLFGVLTLFDFGDFARVGTLETDYLALFKRPKVFILSHVVILFILL
jgi:hypothetical protein